MADKRIETVLVTGASSGIGRVTCLRLAERGYTVIGTSRSLDRLAGLFDDAEERGLRLWGVEMDVNSDESVESVGPGLIGQFGSIHALVNNAGFGVWGPIESLSIEELKTQFEANFFGAGEDDTRNASGNAVEGLGANCEHKLGAGQDRDAFQRGVCVE